LAGQIHLGWLRLGLILVVAAGLAFLGYQAWGQRDESLPVRNWNPLQVQRLSAKTASSVTFAVLGDSRGSRKVFPALLQLLQDDPDVAFAVHLGDLVDKPDLGQYRVFFRQVRENFIKPLLVTVGNHELTDQGRPLYRELFGPENFAFSLQDAYFIGFDDAQETSLTKDHLSWLTRELQKAQAYSQRLVFLHVPLFDPRGGEKPHSLPPERGRRLAELFRRYGVTHIFAGHIHGYFTGEWFGVPFTISGGAGAKLYGAEPQHFFYHAVKVSVRGKEMTLKVKRLPEGVQEKPQAWQWSSPRLGALAGR